MKNKVICFVMLLLVFGAGILCGNLVGADIDLLSQSRNIEIELDEEVFIVNSRGNRIHIPVGTVMNYVKSYEDQDTYSISIITIDRQLPLNRLPDEKRLFEYRLE